MKSKFWITGFLALCMASPAMAEGQIGLDAQNIITAENDPTQLAQGKGCNQGTLGVTEGIANIEAIWNPNQITLNWYKDKNDVNPSTTECTYGETITLPSAPAQRAGYVFAGWKIRVAEALKACWDITDENECDAREDCDYWYGNCYISDCGLLDENNCDSYSAHPAGNSMLVHCRWTGTGCISGGAYGGANN